MKDVDLQEKYRMPALTIDTIILRKNDKKYPDILLIKRRNPPEVGKYALVGGFVRYNEYPELTIYRKIREETGLNNEDFEDRIELFTIRGDPKRDPRRHIITIVYIINIKAESKIKLNNNIKEQVFFNLEKVLSDFKNEMSFDHYSIIEELIGFRNIRK